MDMLKVGLMAIAGILLALQFRQQRPELSIVVAIAVCVLIAIGCLQYFQIVYRSMEEMGSYLEQDSAYFKLLLKAIGITYISEFCAGICRDSGFLSIASQIEIFAKVAILIIGMPIVITLLETMQRGIG